MYYRIHASVLKFLLTNETSKHSIPFDSLDRSLCRAANLPFVTCVEKDRRTDKRSDAYVNFLCFDRYFRKKNNLLRE